MMMKQFAKAVLASTARRLPWGAREAVFDELCEKMGRYAALQKLAAAYNVEDFIIQGRMGRIQGSSTDTALMPYYGRRGTWAVPTNAALCEFLSGGGTLLDIGANLGLTTIPAAQNPAVRVIAFEPEPECYRHLVVNVSANCRHGNVETRNVAVFERNTTLQFEVSVGNLADSRIRTRELPGALHEEDRKTIDVKAQALDGAVEIRGPLAVKMDTQGAEPFVILGGRETLRRAGLVCMEFWPYGMSRMAADMSVAMDFIRGFSSIAIGREEEEAPKDMSLREAEKLLTALDPGHPSAYVDIYLRR